MARIRRIGFFLLLISSPLLSQRVVLRGVIRPEAQPLYDQGPVADDTQLNGITFILRPSADQQTALEKLLADQQDASSPEYHHWLTPQQFAERFAPKAADFGRVTAWLRDQGFSIGYAAQGRNWILFNGMARQVKNTFGCEIHRYRVNGELHYANSTEPSIPAAFAPMVRTLMGLDDFRMKPAIRRFDPRYTSSNGTHYLAPGDLSVIYDINPLYAKNITGSGQKIAIVGQTSIDITDIESFRSDFGLVKNDPQLILAAGSANPGLTGDQAEADLDLEWSGAIAPSATILFVYSTNVVTSELYAVDQSIAPIISSSYGGCEPEVSGTSASTADAFQSLAQEANALGMTWLASSGDQGAATCDSGKTPATHGLAVDIPASVPEVTGVGGTEFNEGSGKYWNSTNGANGGSALSYIPEMAWNDTLSVGALASTGGGESIFFTKPTWQTGPGVPAANIRYVPDIAFAAASQHDPYMVMTGGSIGYFGGTSVATPVFAGILALLDQYLVLNGGKAGLGNINPTLYSLAQNSPGIFHDITVGTNEVPCEIGTANCNSGSMGYNTGVGYDPVTGVGSADAYNLVTEWNSQPVVKTTTTVTASPPNILVTVTTTLTVTVKAASGATTPTGTVSFSVGNTTLGSANLSGSAGTATASFTVEGILLSTGANSIRVTYSGSTSFGSSSASQSVNVSVPTSTSAVIPSATPDPAYQQQPDTNGNSWFVTLHLAEIAGVATSFNSLTVNGQDYSSSIAGLFGSRTLPAHGTLSAFVPLGANLTLPGNIVFVFGGSDLSGLAWSEQITVPFYGPQLSAAMTLSSSPGTEVLNPKGDPNCDPMHPYYQELNLQELNGHEVYLTDFLMAGNFTANNPVDPFNSWRVAPLGAVQAGLCLQLTSAPPQTLTYEVDGVDDGGNTIKTTLSVVFDGAGGNVGALSVSKPSLALSVAPGQTTSTSLTVNAPAGQAWTLSVLPLDQTTRWLVVSPQSGTGTTTVNVSASAADLSNGGYTATLVFQCVATIPQFVNVPVSLVATGPTTMAINGVANGAAFNQTFAPGMILSVFGANLTNSATPLYAPSVPLPFTMGGSTATVNGLPAPFYYASETQLNIQIPYETPAGPALLAVINNGQVATFPFTVSATAPGIFVDATNSIVPVSSAAPGQVLTLFMTGEGDVNPPIATGATPLTSTPVNQLPAPRRAFSMKVAGLPVTPQFIGIPYGLVGETQVNFAIPPNAPPGQQQVVVTVGGNSSVAAYINVTQ